LNRISNRIIFIGDIPRLIVIKTSQSHGAFCNDHSNSFLYLASFIVPCALFAILVLGLILPVSLGSTSFPAYADLPTERDPDIDIETVRLGKGSIAAGGIRILADLGPFYIIDGHVEFNAPSNARNLKVVAAESDRDSLTHAVIINPVRIREIRTGEALYQADLDDQISGRNPWTGDSDKVDNYNNVYLMNIGRGERPISFNDQSQATITVVFASP
jgi:hypothetical protein